MPLILFLVAAVFIGAALFGSDWVRGFVADPTNAILVQVLIGVLGVLAAVIGLWSKKKQRAYDRSHQLSIRGGVRQKGSDNTLTIANQINPSRKDDSPPPSGPATRDG